MNIEIIAVGDQAELVFIDRCSEAVLNKDLSESHVLAQYKSTTLYFTLDRKCTYDSLICWDDKLMLIMCILNKNDLARMNSKLIYNDSENDEYAVEIVYEYVDYALNQYFSRNENPPYR